MLPRNKKIQTKLDIPKTIKIEGRTWKIRVVDGLEATYGYVGRCVFTRSTIEIDAAQTPKELRSTLSHEILHACFPQNIVRERTEERIVGAMEEPVYDAFKQVHTKKKRRSE